MWTVYEMAGSVLPDGCDVAASFLTRCRGSQYFHQCRCGDFGLVSWHKPAEHRIPDVSAAPTLRRHVSRPVAAGVSLIFSPSRSFTLRFTSGARRKVTPASVFDFVLSRCQIQALRRRKAACTFHSHRMVEMW